MPANYPSAPDSGEQSLPPLPRELDPRGKHPGGRGGRSRVWLGAFFGAKVLCSLLSASLVLIFAYGWWNYRDLNSNLRRLSITTGAHQKGHHDIDGKDQNILIVGNDDRTDMTDAEVKALNTGRDGGSLATDTMMIVHVPASGAKATLISLPRDSYVEIPGHGSAKLNSAYASAYSASGGSTDAKRAAGANLLIKTISDLTGLTIDHFVQVDLIGFYRISNAVGGVTVNLCHAVDDSEFSHLVLPAGKHNIRGVLALEFVRQRHGLPNGDLDRVLRQRYFLTAAFRTIASAGTLLNPTRLRNLVSAVDKSIYVDGTFNVLSLAAQLSSLSADNIVGKTIPTDGFGTSDTGESIVKVNPAEVKTFVNQLIGTADTKLSTAKAVAPSTVTVDVMNAGGTDGAASQSAAVLKRQGFVIGTAGTAGTPSATTVIEYRDGMQAQAKTLAAYVPGATLRQVSSLHHVTLILGADNLTAKAKPVPAKTTTSAHAPSAPAAPKPKPIDASCVN